MTGREERESPRRRGDGGPLEGHVVVVTDAEAARAVSAAGAATVVASSRAEVAAVVTELERAGRRVAHFTGDLTDADDRAALGEMLAELFPPASPVEPP